MIFDTINVLISLLTSRYRTCEWLFIRSIWCTRSTAIAHDKLGAELLSRPWLIAVFRLWHHDFIFVNFAPFRRHTNIEEKWIREEIIWLVNHERKCSTYIFIRWPSLSLSLRNRVFSPWSSGVYICCKGERVKNKPKKKKTEPLSTCGRGVALRWWDAVAVMFDSILALHFDTLVRCPINERLNRAGWHQKLGAFLASATICEALNAAQWKATQLGQRRIIICTIKIN